MNYFGQYIPLNSFGVGAKTQEIERVGIEAIILEYEEHVDDNNNKKREPVVLKVRRFPQGNILASFLYVHLDGSGSSNKLSLWQC